MRFRFQNRICCTIAAAFAVWLSPVAFAPGAAPVPISVLMRNADAIVIAKIVDGISGQRATILHLDVQESLQGDVAPGNILSAEYLLRGGAAQNTTAVDKDRGLFFLRREGGRWSIVPVTSGYLSSFRRAFFVLPDDSARKPFAVDARASLHERLVGELAGALVTGGVPEGGGVVFMSEFRSNKSPAMKALFAQFRTSTHRVLRAAGLRASLYDEDGLSAVESGWGRLSADEIRAVADEIQTYIVTTDSGNVRTLGRLVVSEASPAQLRKASLTALAKSHTAETLRYLARFLDDPDAELRSLASGGIAMFANNFPAGQHQQGPGPCKYCTMETFRNAAMGAKVIQDNPGIVAFWKAWWAKHQSELP